MTGNDFWITLGIEPTKDEAEIRKAYMSLLPNFHPEDDPEGFQRLRAAYEAALAFTKESDEESQDVDSSESGLIVTELSEILDNFVRRLNPQEWKAVLDREECAAIDLQSQISEKLLVVLMGNYYLPKEIWALLDSYFNWSDTADILKEKFPPAYIDYVLNGIKYEEIVRAKFFDLSNPDADFVGFLDRYYSINEALNNGDFDAVDQMMNENEGPLFNHLDYRILIAYYYNNKEDKESAEKAAIELLEEHSDDIRVMQAAGNVYLRGGNPEQAIQYFEGVLSSGISYVNSAKVGLARCYFDMENFEKSKEICLEMLVDYYFDDYVSAMFHASSEKLIPIYEEALIETPNNQDIIYKLSSCYFNEGVYDKCLDLVKDVEPEEKYIAKHCEIVFDTMLELNDYNEGIPEDVMKYLYRWEETEINRKRLRYLPQKYLAIDMPDIALEKADIYLLEFPADPEICVVQARIFRSRQMGVEAHRAIDEGLKTVPSHPGLLSEKAHLFQEEGDIGAAVNCAEEALASFPYLLDLREMIVKAYFDAEQYERVDALLQEAGNLNSESNILSMYRAGLDITLDREVDDAASKLQELLIGDEDNVFILEKLGDYYTSQKNPKEGKEIYDKLIRITNHPYHYLLRGWLLSNSRDYFGSDARDLAIMDFNKAIEINPDYAHGYFQLGLLSYEIDDTDKAIEYFEKAISLDAIRPAYIYLIRSYSFSGNISKAESTANNAIALYNDREDDESVTVINREKIEVYYDHKIYREALNIEKFVLDENGQTDNSRLYMMLAECHFQNYEDEIAERFFSNAVALDPNNEEIIRAYANFKFYGRRDPAAAIDLYQRALQIRPYYRTHVRLGKVFASVGQRGMAKRHFKEALKIVKEYLKTNNIPCLDYYIAECYFGLNKIRQAEIYVLKSIENSADYSSCNTHYCYESAFLLAEIYRCSGNKQRAREYYSKVIDMVPDREYAEARGRFEQ